MKITKYIKVAALSFAALTTFSACDNGFEEMNTNPNGPLEVSSGLLVTSILENTSDQMHSTFVGGDMGGTWAQHWAKVQYNDEARYQPRVNSFNTLWTVLYANSITDAREMRRLAIQEENKAAQGVALTLEAFNFALATDLWGDVPYTDAMKANEGVIAPKYDKQADIYTALVAKLDTAANFLAMGQGSVPGSNDIMYGGNISKWEKFANSLKVRVLMRMSDVPEMQSFVQAELQKVINKPLFTSNADNASVKYVDANGNRHPLHNTIILTNRQEWKIASPLVDLMKTYNDPRLAVYAEPNDAGEIRGVLPGVKDPTNNGYSVANSSGLGEFLLEPNFEGLYMTYSELNFLLAEAAVKGLISGDASEYYAEGIRASFDFFGADGADAYIAAQPLVGNQLQLIAEQNWIALYGQGMEAWTEYRRTGYPQLSPAADPLLGYKEVPSRYTYPNDEQTLNSANYKSAVAEQGADRLDTQLWWDKK